RMVKDLFKHLSGQGLTIFMSTHTLKVAEDVCDRIGIINKGVMIATGTTDDLKKLSLLADADLEDAFIKLTS
ncbi:MAG: ABC transporter ATP-binding protein, partial [Desulfobacterales bacterium]|nr:ABC transporter ATP-binding protein [Desulfobacterales bacterium]